jgi:hypothetical protein
MRGAYQITLAQNTVNDVRNCYWMTPTLLYCCTNTVRREVGDYTHVPGELSHCTATIPVTTPSTLAPSTGR